MIETWIRYDLRSPSFGTPTAQLTEAVQEQSAWADRNGFDAFMVAEHHGSPDGYNPSPFVLATLLAAHTKQMRINLTALLLPLHDPIRVAEDSIMIDYISRGRFEITVGMGYIGHEFEMFGVDPKTRGALADSKLAAIRQCFNGETFEYEGRRGKVTPLPYTPGGPKIYVGGALKATAVRAGRYGDGFFPMKWREDYNDLYRQACAEHGRPVGHIVDCTGPMGVFVAEDPERAWAQIGPHAMHEANSYADAGDAAGVTKTFLAGQNPNDLLENGTYAIMTPDECIAFARKQAAANPARYITLVPLIGGLSPDIGSEMLELYASKVLPALKEPAGATATA